ncbi:MAG: type II toxin-antitoxin system RatA family toxin [Burkholderiales bacterium]|jgi:ribosome-associated toxin RatA of RatAB toxin-antitoxin module|nr:type II toxin-antitoxin system RatA family toxin [Burkholderiales bacterium]
MKRVAKSVLLWYSPREMYTLVIGVSEYPQFLPWCERAELLERHADGVTARLHLAYAGVRHAFTTRSRNAPDVSVQLALVDGPFSQLDGNWHFIALPIPGGDSSQACRVQFQLDYAFSNSALEAVLSPVFDRIANTLVDSFVKRAEQVYGPR